MLPRCWRQLAVVITFAIMALTGRTAEMSFWGPGFLDDARAVGLAPNGDVWVGCSGRIAVFAADGTFKEYRHVGIGQVNSIAFTPHGDPVIGCNDGFFAIFHGEKRVDVPGFGQYSPWEVTMDDTGAFYGADGGNSVVKKFDVTGMLPVVLQIYKAPDADPMVRPYSVALDAQRNVYVTDENKNGLCIFSNDGKFLRRILTDQRCFRIRRGPQGKLYVVTGGELLLLAPETGEIQARMPMPDGSHNAMGFAVDAQGSLYLGNFYGGTVTKMAANGKAPVVFGPSYRARMTVPDNWTPGATVTVPFTLEKIGTKPLGQVPPTFSIALLPAALPGEPDSNFANLQSTAPDPAWDAKRDVLRKASSVALTVKQDAASLQVTAPADLPMNLYRLQVHADCGAPGGVADNAQAVRVVAPGASGNMTLYVPHQRTVFQQGETVELNVILRGKNPLPAGALRFSLANRQGEAVDFQPKAPLWQEFHVAATSNSTLTFRVNAGDIHPGRYLLQAEYLAGELTLRDSWPLQVVTTVEPTRFRILFPEWSAGYTDIWGPFTGKGMREDAAAMAKEGILLYDTLVVGRNQDPDIHPIGQDGQQAPALMAQAAADPALPAPERFMQASPLEIELQEALRNGMTVQRDIWGSHFLGNWGYGTPLSIARDNRLPQLWTQWQREWPSWIGHRYLTLSIDEGDNQERVGLKKKLQQTSGLIAPSDQELVWARNGMQRRFISDAPSPVEQAYAGIGADKAGNIFLASRGGTLIRYTPDGKQAWVGHLPSGEVIDIAVAADGTVYGAHMGNIVTVTPFNGPSTSWPTPGFNGYSPRGVCIEKDGNLLLSDEENGRVCRYSPSGKFLAEVANKRSLQRPAGISTMRDGTIAVLDSGRGGTVLLKPDGSPVDFLKGAGSHSPGGKGAVFAAPDDTLWVTEGYGTVRHLDRTGKQLGTIGSNSFTLGAMSLPMALGMTPKGNILVSDVALPFAQEFSPTGDPVRMLGLNTVLADVRIDRSRYLWSDRIIATVWMPVAGQNGDPHATLAAFARQGNGPWQAQTVEAFSGGDYGISVPKLTGEATLRLVWAPPGADTENPLHADYTVQVSEEVSTADQTKADDIFKRQQSWVTSWAKTRMGTLSRWTQLSDRIRPGTQDTAPTNYGTPDSLAEGVWVPWRRTAVVAECENEGHDHGSFPLMGPWYVARALEGPNAKPAWCSLLQWYWTDDKHLHRPTRDTVLLLGAGASGIGTGTLVTRMTPSQLAIHRKMVDRLQRLGEATMALELPGRDGVAVLHSFTQEAMDPYMEEHFYTAHAAWYDLLRVHVPTAVVSEESIARDALLGRYKAVLLPCIQFQLPAATLAGLDRFRKSGGEIWIDLGSRISITGAKLLKTRYRAFWAQDAYYWMHDGYGVGGYDGNYEYWRMRQGSDQRLPAIKEAFARFAKMPVSSDDADVYLQQRQGGAASYIFASNDHYPDKPLYKTWLAGDTPTPAKVAFTLTGGAIYDALAMKPVQPGALTVNFTDEEPACIWAVLPQAIDKVSATATLQGDMLAVSCQVNGADGKAIPAVIPMKITITDAQGAVQQLWRSTDAHGVCTVQVPINWMAPQGAWKVAVSELLSGQSASATATVPAKAPAAITQDASPVLTFDAPAISNWMQAMKDEVEVWIALDKGQDALAKDARDLATALQARGINARVIDIDTMKESPIALNYTMPDDQKTVLEQMRAGKLVGMRQQTEDFKTNGPQRMVLRPLILLGDPTQNRWLADIANYHLLRRPLSPCYPGAGRALLQYVWAPFYDGYDAVTISATDVAGVEAGIVALEKL